MVLDKFKIGGHEMSVYLGGRGHFHFGLYGCVPPNRVIFHRNVPYNRVYLSKFCPTIEYDIYRMKRYSEKIW